MTASSHPSGRITFAALLVGSTLALLWPALHNGYPLLRFDTPVYVQNALSLDFFPGRPPGYALLLHGALAGGTLWLAPLCQALVTSLLALRLARALHADPRVGLVAGAGGLALALLVTPLAPHASTLMPDALTSWLFLGGALCLVSAQRSDVWLGATACCVGLLVHSSHLPVGVASLGACVAVGALCPAARGLSRRRLAAVALCLALSVATLLALGRSLRGGAPLGGHPAFLVARLHGHGLLLPTLDLHCPESGWRLCAHREALTHVPKGEATWWFLWDRNSPFAAIGHFDAAPELREIAAAGARSFLPEIAARTLRDAWSQLWKVETHKGIVPEPARSLARVLAPTLPVEAARIRAADQASRRPAILLLPFPEAPLHAALWVGALLLALRCLRRGRPAGAWLLAATAGFLALHALVVAFGNPPFGRLQGRVAWLMAYALVIAGSLGSQAASKIEGARPTGTASG